MRAVACYAGALFILPVCLRTGMHPMNIPSSLAKGLYVAVDMSCVLELCYSALCLLL